jgi:hypothetical protein
MNVQYDMHTGWYRNVDPVAHLRGSSLSLIKRPFEATVLSQIKCSPNCYQIVSMRGGLSVSKRKKEI